jgi:hypothetical protein
MKSLHQILPGNIRGNPFLALLILALALVGAYEAANFILAGDGLIYVVGGIRAYEDFVLNAYSWLQLGILFQLPHIKKSIEFAAARHVSAQPRPRWIV